MGQGPVTVAAAAVTAVAAATALLLLLMLLLPPPLLQLRCKGLVALALSVLVAGVSDYTHKLMYRDIHTLCRYSDIHKHDICMRTYKHIDALTSICLLV